MSAPNDSVTTSRWQVAAASRRGSAHRGRAPNQDALRTQLVVDAADRPIWLLAVSDGHGGPRYVRSHVGSRIAVDVAVELLDPLLAVGRSDGDLAALLRRAVPEIVEEWRHRVLGHHAAQDFTEEESSRAGDPELGRHPIIAYGATLVVALVGEHGLAVAQIGDGDALVRTHGYATRPVPGDARLVAGETTSLCLDSAATDFRYAALPPAADVDLVLLATDGYGNSFADRDWWHHVVDDLADFAASHGFDELRERFPEWLDESALVGGDDVSCVLVVLDPWAVEPTVPAPALPRPSAAADTVPMAAQPVSEPRPLPQPGDPIAGGGERRRRLLTVGALVVVALLVLAVVVAGALALTGDDGDPRGPTPRDGTTPSPGVAVTPSTPPHDDGGRREPPAGDPEEPGHVDGPDGEPPPAGGPIGEGSP